MSLTNPNTPVSQKDLQDFYHRILPYLGGSNEGGSGHTIEDAEGTDLTQRDTLQFGEGLSATDDPTNEKTIVDIDSMSAEDMDDIFDELPTGGNIAVTGYIPLGTLISFYGETAPKFFLACDGSVYNKADYPELANHLLSLTNNTPYIVDGDDTKFKVPDLRGEFLRGTGTNSNISGLGNDILEGSGANVGEHQGATVVSSILTSGNIVTLDVSVNSEITDRNHDAVKTNLYRNMVSKSTQDKLAQIGTVRPTNTSVLFCIAYKDIYSNPMNDYSTIEKIVGTWIDGKPLYQKTITANMPTSSDQQTVAYSDSSIDCFVSYSGMAQDNNNRWKVNMPNTWGSDYIRAYWDISNKSFMIACNRSDYINGTLTITIQYTKTTD